MQSHARLVVIGAGIVGCSTVYHLTRLGWKDIVVLDQGPLFDTGGSTSHAPGLVFQTNFSKMMTDLSRNAVALYNALNLDGQPCFYPVGSFEVAYTGERLEDLKRKLGAAKAWNLEAHLISPEEARARLPLLDADRIHGAYYVPSDGIAKAVRACEAMARASEPGATFHGRTTVTGIEVANGRIRGVDTDRGRIAADQVLICAGIWGASNRSHGGNFHSARARSASIRPHRAASGPGGRNSGSRPSHPAPPGLRHVFPAAGRPVWHRVRTDTNRYW